MSYADLAQTIEAAWEARNEISFSTQGPVREAVDTALELLDSGKGFRVSGFLSERWLHWVSFVQREAAVEVGEAAEVMVGSVDGGMVGHGQGGDLRIRH